VFSSQFRGTLNSLFATRLTADYRAGSVSPGYARRGVELAAGLVEAVCGAMGMSAAQEERAAYEASMKTKQRVPEMPVAQVEDWIRAQFPHASWQVRRRSDRDFTVDVWGIREEERERFCQVYELTSDILVDDDVWIVIVPLPSGEH
jgi:hypothetical protein